MTSFLLRNATLVDAFTPEPREGFDVLIEGDTIREVSDVPIRAADAPVFDLAGRTLMPGLIDAHVHAMAVTTDLHELALIPPSLVTAQTKGTLEGMLDRGFTTVRDAGGADWGLAEAVRRGYLKGPRLFICGFALAQTGGQGDFRRRGELYLGCPACSGAHTISLVVDGVDEVRRAVRERIRQGADHIKVMAAGGMVSGVPIERPHFSLDELRAMVEEAAAAGTYLMAHAYESQAVRRCVEVGARTIEHGNLIDADTAALMAERGAWLVPTMTVYEGFRRHGEDLGYSQSAIDRFAELVELSMSALEMAKVAGVRIGHGSDLEGILHPYQSHELLLKAEVLTPHEVITSATATNAELMGMAGKLGVIAEDALADLLVVDGDPLADLGLLQDQGAHLSLIMKGGEIHKNAIPS